MPKHNILINGIKLYAHHGVMPQEQKVGAWFTVDANIQTDFTSAMQTDELEGTISYADVYEIIKAEMSIPSKLLEHASGRMARAILQRFPTAKSVCIRLIKDNPPMGAECLGAGVEITMDRQEA